MSERLLKGGVLLGYYNFIRHQWGDDGVDACIQETGVDPRQLKEEALYPRGMNTAILQWISGTKGIDYIKKAGNHTIKNLGLLSYLVHFGSMNRFLQKAKANYQETFLYGEVSILNDGFAKRATVIMKDCNSIEEASNAWIGAFEGMMELTRSKGTVKQVKRQVDGADYDEFLLDWE
jgi:hypothetical protein